MRMRDDGRIRWHVGYPGDENEMEGRLSPKQRSDVIRRISDAGFFDWEPEVDFSYRHSIKDCGVTEVTVTRDGLAKTVSSNSCVMPPAFGELVEFLTSGAGAAGNPVIDWWPSWF